MTIEMLVPFNITYDGEPIRVSAELPARDQLKLLLVENGKRKAREVLTAFGQALAASGVAAEFTVVTKATAAPMEADEVAKLVGAQRSGADVVVVGVGDCGGCSSSAALDAIEFRKHGVFAAVIASQPFEFVVSMITKQNGAADLPYFLVEHPVWTRDDAWISVQGRELAVAFEAMLAAREPGAVEAPVEARLMELDEVYRDLRASLAGDDFSLDVSRDDDRYIFSISAGPSACADCLVPVQVFQRIVLDVGINAGLDIQPDLVVLEYPRL